MEKCNHCWAKGFDPCQCIAQEELIDELAEESAKRRFNEGPLVGSYESIKMSFKEGYDKAIEKTVEERADDWVDENAGYVVACKSWEAGMKYKELPLDESKGNPFKVGDRVRIYDHSNTYEGYIKCINDNQNVVVIVNEATSGRVAGHWKQCRKLEIDNPREWFIHPLKGLACPSINGLRVKPLILGDQVPEKIWHETKDDIWIRVREVLEE